MAEAALLVVGDLPSGDWVMEELALEEGEASAPDWPEECGDTSTQPWYEDGALALRGRVFTIDGSSGDAVSMFVTVFENAEALEEGIAAQAKVTEQRSAPACTEAMAARSAARGSESRSEEPHYAMEDDHGNRMISVFGTTEVTSEVHFFVRGRVMAMYSILGSDEVPRGIDHQALLEAFAARVVGAQE